MIPAVLLAACLRSEPRVPAPIPAAEPALVVEPSPAPAPEPAPTGAESEVCADPFVARLAAGTRHWAETPLTEADFGTGTALFDQEWLFGSRAMATVGLGQHAALCPSEAAADIAAMEQTLRWMLSPEGLAFDRSRWGSDVTERLGSDRGSIAALGYGGLALAAYRAAAPSGGRSEEEAAWTRAIAARLGRELVETYPGERYPVDNAAAIAALSLHDRVTGEDHGQALASAIEAVRRARDPATGLLHQSVASGGRPLDRPRGSGTFLTAWLLRRADPELARSMYEAGRDRLGGELLGAYAMREYPEGVDGLGDIDSGPLVFGFSVSATGFALGGAAAFGDGQTERAILETIRTLGPAATDLVPGLRTGEGGATGAALGDALLLAMLTSRER